MKICKKHPNWIGVGKQKCPFCELEKNEKWGAS